MSEFSGSETLRRYFALMAECPELFRRSPDEAITILTDPAEIQAAVDFVRRQRRAAAMKAADLRVGVLADDPYMTIVRDPVRFMDGSMGLYNRVVESGSVAVIPIYRERLVLLEIFRHGTHEWMLEFPRGAALHAESSDDAARREVAEELGGTVAELVDLGRFTPGGSSIAVSSRLFGARLAGIGDVQRGESIRGLRLVSASEFERLVGDGAIFCGFTMAAYLRARVMGFL